MEERNMDITHVLPFQGRNKNAKLVRKKQINEPWYVVIIVTSHVCVNVSNQNCITNYVIYWAEGEFYIHFLYLFNH